MPDQPPITSFYDKVQRLDFARLFQFRLIQFFDDRFSDDLIYVEAATLPGRAINNVQVPFMGLQFNVPGTANYPGSASYPVTFRCDASYNLRDRLESKLFDTFNDDDSTGNYSIGFGERTSAMADENQNTIHLQLVNSKMEGIRNYKLIGAYLQSLQDFAYDIKDGGSIVTIGATIAYQYWRCPELGNSIG